MEMFLKRDYQCISSRSLINSCNRPRFSSEIPSNNSLNRSNRFCRSDLIGVNRPNSWQASIPNEYGFYANVNPEVDHPRWSQKRERRLGELRKRPTLPFNGYGEQVAQLYAGMDLRANF